MLVYWISIVIDFRWCCNGGMSEKEKIGEKRQHEQTPFRYWQSYHVKFKYCVNTVPYRRLFDFLFAWREPHISKKNRREKNFIDNYIFAQLARQFHWEFTTHEHKCMPRIFSSSQLKLDSIRRNMTER